MPDVITGPGRYETRGGRIVEVTHRQDSWPADSHYAWEGRCGTGRETWATSGDFYDKDQGDDMDIVRRFPDEQDEGPQPCKECEIPRHATGRQLHELSDGTWKMVEVR